MTFRATYEENGVYGECTFTGYVYITNGYTPNTAASLMVDSYALYIDDNEVANLTAGNDAVLKVTLKNNAAKNAIYKTVATLKLSDSNSLILTAGYADAAYVRSIPAGPDCGDRIPYLRPGLRSSGPQRGDHHPDLRDQ